LKKITVPYGFEIQDNQEKIYYGGMQTWYATLWQRKAGCAPTTASNIFAHLARRDPALKALCPFDTANPIKKERFLPMMEEVWRYITPTIRGVNKPEMFISGSLKYAEDRGVSITSKLFEIPPAAAERPSPEEMSAFLEKSISDDLPVAFLNLCNGQVKNLESWHWVTLSGFDKETMHATICDQGKESEIDLALWLKTTTANGGFVTLARDGIM
jgi:hypothetical protein